MKRWLARLSRVMRREKSELEMRARRAEVRGELTLATELFLQAGAKDEVGRVLSLRAKSAPSGTERLELLNLARDYSGEARRAELGRQTAVLRLELCQQRMLLLTRAELGELGCELAAHGEHRRAADAFGLAGDLEAQTTQLVEAGAIDRLEAVWDADQRQLEAVRSRERAVSQASDLFRAGRRRAALALLAEQPERHVVRLLELERHIRLSRVIGPEVALSFHGQTQRFVLGDRVSLGRQDASIVLPSPAISRTHLMLERAGEEMVVRDVSRNGTTLGGVPLAAPLPLSSPLELVLGGEVRVKLIPHARFGVCIVLPERTLLAPLGELDLEAGRVSSADDRWVELEPAASGAYLNSWRVTERIQLCRRDELSLLPGAPPIARVEE